MAMLDPVYSLPLLIAGDLDLALCHDAELAADSALEVVPLFEDPMYVAMPSGHPLADAPGLDLASFASEPWMLATTQSCPDSRLFLRACHRAGFEPQIAFQHDDYPAILGFVAAGVGVALIPDMVTRQVRDDVVVRTLDRPPPPRPIAVVVPSGYRSPAAAAMLAIMREVSDAWVAERPALAAV
jgi:DNA-binding transcriptional LysR family regulator